VYDIRNENHLSKIIDKEKAVTHISSDQNVTVNTSSTQSQPSNRAWTEWWKDKRKNDQDFLAAAENGNLAEVKKLLNKKEMLDLVADINVKGLD
jgi:hypothetical protein